MALTKLPGFTLDTSSNVTFANANVSGNLTSGNANLGNLTTSNYFAGVLTTAAQPNITSIGALTELTVSGGTVATGNVLLSGPNISLGDASNLHIAGGTANYFLQTDGAGNLSWGAAGGGGISQGLVTAISIVFGG